MTDPTTYLHTVFGTTVGRAHLAIGSGPFVSDRGRYQHRSWSESTFGWPEEAERLARSIGQAVAAEDDVYVCPYLMVGEKRAKGAAVERTKVHADLDGDGVPLDLIGQLGAYAVASGTPGHAHVYVDLEDNVPAHWHELLCRGLGAFLGDADAKISDNDLLRPPGTLSHKARVRDGVDPTPVEWLRKPSDRRWNAQELARTLGVTLPARDAPRTVLAGVTGATVVVENVTVDALPAKVRDALAEATGDRSADTMRVVGACHDAGLTLAQTRGVVALRSDLAARLAGRHDDDVLTCWLKATDSRAERRAESAPVAPIAPLAPVSPEGPEETGAVLDDVRNWLSRFIATMTPADLDLLTLWAAHTWLCVETYTTPRLVLDSPVPGSGKTTTLEHLDRLCVRPVQAASLSSPALLARMLNDGVRTILIDEADRSLDPKKEGVAELLAILNSGYKRGGTRPVLVPGKEGKWVVSEMPTFAPVAMAGNNPALPEDTRQRCIRVLLLPDLTGRIEESDWEFIDADARTLGHRLARWADRVRDDVRGTRPPLPDGITGRARERWAPLKRVAVMAGGTWPTRVDEMALHDKEQIEMDREDGMIREKPALLLLRHLHDLWPATETFMPTVELCDLLARNHPDEWGDGSPFGKAITAQRLGRMLATSYKINSTRLDRDGARGYVRATLAQAWQTMGIEAAPVPAPVRSTPPEQTGASGADGETGTPEAGCSLHAEPRPDVCWTCENRAAS